MGLRWRSMDDGERERQYSPSSRLPGGGYQPFLDAYRERSVEAMARATTDGATITVIRPGNDDLPAVHLIRPADTPGPLPVLAFVHGGYWQELSAAESLFPATACLARGWPMRRSTTRWPPTPTSTRSSRSSAAAGARGLRRWWRGRRRGHEKLS